MTWDKKDNNRVVTYLPKKIGVWLEPARMDNLTRDVESRHAVRPLAIATPAFTLLRREYPVTIICDGGKKTLRGSQTGLVGVLSSTQSYSLFAT